MICSPKNVLVAAVGVVGAVGVSVADSPLVLATQDPAQVSDFVLDFGPGGVATANITTTRFVLELDAGDGGAAFVSYEQHVDPLILPGGISTGNIIVKIVPGSSSGAFDPATGSFATSELYLIYFEADLSMFGLTSPVTLPGASTGQAQFDSPSTGTIAMAWSGSGELQNPFDPTQPIPFDYVCHVNTVFSKPFGDLNCDGAANGMDIEPFITALSDPAEYGSTYPECELGNGDFNQDGTVNGFDIGPFIESIQ